MAGGLVDYGTSSDEDDEHEVHVNLPMPSKRRKLLPSLPASYPAGAGPRDDPSQHQGRTRSRPFVPGEYNAHLYVNLPISKSLNQTIHSLIARAQTHLPNHTLHSLLTTPTPSQTKGELHISLTHPLPLRRSQIEGFRASIRTAVSTWAQARARCDQGAVWPFHCSLAGTVRVYHNGQAGGGEGKGGRAFMALRVGAGSSELKDIAEKAINPILERLHLPKYHDEPEYHASFAWCLHDGDGIESKKVRSSGSGARPKALESDKEDVDLKGQDLDNAAMLAHPSGDGRAAFPFTIEMLAQLDADFEKEVLGKQPKAGWGIDSVVLRIGKEVTTIPLQ